jgi:lysozyme family protein
MSRDNLDDSLELMFGHEGGYSAKKTDKGNYLNGVLVGTKYGITGKTLAAHRGVSKVTASQVKSMTIKEAEAIYRKSYWASSGGDVLPSGLDYSVFDSGVTSGPLRAVKILQGVLAKAKLYAGAIDGWIGEGTMKAVGDFPGGVTALIGAYCDARMAFMQAIKGPKGFSANGRGWTIRVTGIDPKGEWAPVPGVIGNALAMAAKQPVAKTAEAPKAMETLVSEEGSAKAEATVNPWTKPDVLLPIAGAGATAAGGVATAAAPAVMSSNYLQIALSVGIVALVLVGAYYAFTRIRKAA